MAVATTNVDLLRRVCPAAFYKPNPPASEAFILSHGGMPGSRSGGDKPWFESDARLRVSLGGNRAGKTTKLVLETGAFCVGMRPWYDPSSEWYTRGLESLKMKTIRERFGERPPARCRYIVPNFKVHLPEVVNAFRNWWPRDWYTVASKDEGGRPRTLRWFNGSEIEFMSHHMEPGDFEGVEMDWLAFDEPPTERIWTALTRGTVSTGGRVALGATLLDASGWFWESVVGRIEKGMDDDAMVTYHSIWDNTEENGGCPGQTVRNVKSFLEMGVLDADVRMAREHGMPIHIGGLILSGLSLRDDVIDPIELPEDCLIFACIDPAGSRPFAGLHIAYVPDKDLGWVGHIFDETYIPQSKNDLGLFCSEWLKKGKGEGEIKHPHPPDMVLIDPFAEETQKADTYGRSMRRILSEDWNIQTSLADKRNKRARLLQLNSRFRRHHYKVWNNCRRLLLEARKWTWDASSAKLTSGPDDVCDCLSYIDSMDPPAQLTGWEGEEHGVWVPEEYRDRERRGESNTWWGSARSSSSRSARLMETFKRD